MKRKPYKLIASLLFAAASCNEPVTVVTDVVHTDGSVSRTIEMKSMDNSSKDRFRTSDLPVPLDGTWSVKDSCEISEKGDTTWVRRAIKLFKDADDINLTYKNDSGPNRDIARLAEFRKTFKWFNTKFRFSEKISQKLTFGYPAEDILSEDELRYFYAPPGMQETWKDGPDSLKFTAISDSTDAKMESWAIKNLVSGWIQEFSKLAGSRDTSGTRLGSLTSRENEMFSLIRKSGDDFDSLWTNGVILKELIGESDYNRFKPEADSALDIIIEEYFVDFKEYSVRIVMPGMVTATNGFIDTSEILVWPVQSDYFLTQDYEMWAESKIQNWWAWIVSGIFLAFVLTGIIIKVIKKG